jgi:integral membrane sensor domain MASE1
MTPEPPPKIVEVPAQVTLAEPVRPVRIATLAADSGPPIHPLAALLLIIVDNLWNLTEWVVIDWIITIPLSFITVFVPVFLIQKLLKRNRVGQALGYALLLGVIAAVPTSLTGTPVGLALLVWAGVGRLIGKPLAR